MFTIEKGIQKTGGRSLQDPTLYANMLDTMEKMEVGDSFFIPVDKIKVSSVGQWGYKKLTPEMNKKILNAEVRAKNPYYFSTSAIKDASGKVLGTRIFRDK